MKVDGAHGDDREIPSGSDLGKMNRILIWKNSIKLSLASRAEPAWNERGRRLRHGPRPHVGPFAAEAWNGVCVPAVLRAQLPAAHGVMVAVLLQDRAGRGGLLASPESFPRTRPPARQTSPCWTNQGAGPAGTLLSFAPAASLTSCLCLDPFRPGAQPPTARPGPQFCRCLSSNLGPRPGSLPFPQSPLLLPSHLSGLLPLASPPGSFPDLSVSQGLRAEPVLASPPCTSPRQHPQLCARLRAAPSAEAQLSAASGPLHLDRG